jgi:hypothetical protein
VLVVYFTKYSTEPFDAVRKSAYKAIVQGHVAPKSAAEERKLIKQGRMKDAYALRAHNVRMLIDKVVRLLDDHSIQYWMDSGVLLGIYNHGDLLPYDADADIGMPSSYVEKLYNISDETLLQYGVRMARRSKKPLLFAIIDMETDVYCDVFVFDVTSDSVSTGGYVWECKGCSGKDFLMPVDVVYPIQTFDLGGTYVLIPNKPKEYLEFLYGRDLDPYFKWDESSQDYVHKTTLRKIVKKYMQKK